MEGGICVEVGPCGDKKLFFKAFLVDIEEKEVTVRFLNNPQHKVNVDSLSVHFSPAASKDEAPIFKEGDIVEVYNSDPTQCCWRTGIVQKLKDGFIVVSFGEKEEEIVPCENAFVRAPNQQPAITKEDILRFEVPVPEKYSKLASLPDAHALFLSTIKAGDCVFLPDTSELKVISLHKESERLARVLIGMHLEHLEQRADLQCVINEGKRFVEKLENQTIREEFQVDEKVLGRAIGVHGSNIQKARQLPDILSVDLQENNFFVVGKTKEAVAKARSILEFILGYAFVPRYLFHKVLSQENQEILKKGSLIMKLHFVFTDEMMYMHLPHKSGHVSVLMNGLAIDIAAAKLQIEYLVNLHSDISKIKRQLNLIAQPNGSDDESGIDVAENGDGGGKGLETKPESVVQDQQEHPRKKSYEEYHKNRRSQKNVGLPNHYDWRTEKQMQVK